MLLSFQTQEILVGFKMHSLTIDKTNKDVKTHNELEKKTYMKKAMAF